MLFAESLIVIRGGGDLGTGVAYRLHRAGFPLLVCELEEPLAVRRMVAVATALAYGRIEIEGMQVRRVDATAEAAELAATGLVPVMVSPQLPTINFDGVVDARMAKRNLDTTIEDAQLVVALGPGFTAGVDCHAVIETSRGPHLGRVIYQGGAEPNTGIPGEAGGKSAERVLRAPATGAIEWEQDIGDVVEEGRLLGRVAGVPLRAPIGGLIRGLISGGSTVAAGQKVGDIDPRSDPGSIHEISDKALAVGGGVLEAVLAWLN